MAQFGAKRPVFAPIKTTPDGALPTYDYEKKVTIGKLVKADLTVTNASGELYGDDALAEKVDMFASGSLALETDDKTDEVQTALYGATKDVESGEVTDSDGDVAPRGGLVYPLFQGHLPSRNKGNPRQRQRRNKGFVYHVRHVQHDVYNLPLQFRRMAHYEGIHR